MRWDVDFWSEMERLRREMGGMYQGYGRPSSNTYPLVNVYEDKDSIVITAELSGMAKEAVGITFADGVLTLKGKREPLASVKDMEIVRRECSTGEFEKTIQIPTKIDQEKIGATFNNGVLTITLPKSEEVKPKTIQIETR